MTQKERVDTNLSKLESEKYIKQIETLKVSEAKTKDQMKKLSKDNADYLKELHDIQKKNEDLVENISLLKGKPNFGYYINIFIEKISVYESKIEELEKKYNKSIMVIEKLEAENIDQKDELDMLRQFKHQNKLQESKISNEYDGILREYKEQIKRLQQELVRQESRYLQLFIYSIFK